MIFGYFIFFVALVISSVAEFYSIAGLTSIFAAAYWPVVIMGVALGVGKITAAVWLKLNWNRASVVYKLYLVPAVAFLMFLTSMGIFGFLSKSHSDLSLVTGDKAAQLAIYDEKIKTSTDNIESNRKLLNQLDEAVDQVMGRSTTEQGAMRSVAIRKSQQKERKRISDEIVAEQKIISDLTEERAVIAAEVRQVEAEVGPIKYIAALIYGNDPDAELLESAVRWVIILIVLVFDPLALCLMLAAQQSLRWAKEEKKKQLVTNSINDETVNNKNIGEVSGGANVEPTIPKSAPPPKLEDCAGVVAATEPVNVPVKEPELELPIIEEPKLELPIIEEPKLPTIDNQNSIDIETNEASLPPIKSISELKELTINAAATAIPPSFINGRLVYIRPPIENFEIKNETVYNETELDTTSEVADLPNEDLSTAESALPAKPIVIQPPEAIAPKAKEIIQVPETIDRNKSSKLDLKPVADNNDVTVGNNVKAHFGITFPVKPEKGELFLRVDYLPTRLFKFNGSKWIEVDKSMTDSYVYNTEYIKFMIKEIDAGRLDPDEISSSEREQIADFLANDEQNNNSARHN